MDENRLPRQFFRRRVGNPATPSSSLAQTCQATDPLAFVPFSMRSSTFCAPAAAFSYLPANFPPWQTVFSHFRLLRLKGTWTLLLRALQRAERERQGRNPHRASRHHGCGIRVKTVEESAGISGFDASRKRHLLVDTLGIPISIYVIPAETCSWPYRHI